MNQVVSLESLANDIITGARPMPKVSCGVSRARLQARRQPGLWSCAATRADFGRDGAQLAENAIRYNVEGGRAHVAIIGAADRIVR